MSIFYRFSVIHYWNCWKFRIIGNKSYNCVFLLSTHLSQNTHELTIFCLSVSLFRRKMFLFLVSRCNCTSQTHKWMFFRCLSTITRFLTFGFCFFASSFVQYNENITSSSSGNKSQFKYWVGRGNFSHAISRRWSRFLRRNVETISTTQMEKKLFFSLLNQR